MFSDKMPHFGGLKNALFTALLGLLSLAMTQPLAEAHAGALQIWPIEISLDAAGNVVEVTVKNTSSADTFVQAMVVKWSLSDGPGSQQPTDEVLVSPPVFDLPSNSSQTLRLALRRPLAVDTERTYRLVVTELSKSAGLVPNTLNVAVSMNMPVFVTPSGAAAKPAWSFANTDFEGQHLVMTNEGNAHLNIKRIALAGAEDQEPVFESEKGGYVLAGEEKRWPIEDALVELKGPVTLRFDTTDGSIETLISLPDR